MASLRLDEEQRRAAVARETRVRVLAGAGTGKTTTLVARARYLLEQGVRPRELCIVTFTRKAAEELARRIGAPGTGVLIGTIHALGLRILRFEQLGRPVADARRAKGLVLQAMRDCGTKDPLPKINAMIRRAKAFGSPYPLSVRAVGTRYEKLLEDNNLWDFDDLILKPRQLLIENELAGVRWSQRFTHLLIDEAQDTSTVQWELLECLTTPATNTYTVGDVGQSIYSWRGAEAEGMLDRFHDGAVTYTIGKNYRSYAPILNVANRVLDGKPGAVVLQVARDQPASDSVAACYGSGVTAAMTAALLGLVAPEGKWNPSDICVLARTHACLGEVELACVALNLPYFLVGGISFYERAEILDVLAHLEYAAGVDIAAALERIHNRPSRYLGAAWLAAVHAQGGWQRWEDGGPRAMRWPHEYMSRRAQELWSVCQGLKQFGPDAPAVAVIDYVLQTVGYEAWLRKDGVVDAEQSEDNDVLDNLRVLRDAAAERGASVKEFIAFADACRHRPQRVQGAGGITLSTIHRAKGLEWPVVIVAGCEEGVLPHRMGDPDGEERRLYYVAVTRPQERLILAGSGTPSRYMRESCGVLGLVVPGFPPEDCDGDAGKPGDATAPGAEGDADSGATGRGDGDRAGAPDGGADRGDGPDGAGAGPGSPGDG